MKKCSIPDCSKPRSKRGVTCGPACAHLLRHGVSLNVTVEDDPSDNSEKEKHEVSGDKWQISMDATPIRTLDGLVKKFEIDTRIWEVERFVCNKWEMGSIPRSTGSGKNWSRESNTPIVTELFQIKAWLIKRKDMAAAIEEIEALKSDAASWAPLIHVHREHAKKSGNMVEIALMDVHFGKQGWHRETGSSNYDLNIAIDVFREAFWGVVDRSIVYGVDKFLLPVGNDIFHIDNRSNTTTKGTVVDTDSRYHKIYRRVRQMFCEELERLMQIAPVEVVVVPGNHDEHTSWHLGESLECWFRNAPAFSINNDPILRKYVQHGRCMLGFWHGDKGNKKNYELQLATDMPQMFADTKFREIHCGHLHQETTKEVKGIKTRILPSISGTDYWHAANGFDHNQRCGQGFVWNENEGLVVIANYTLKNDGKRKAA